MAYSKLVPRSTRGAQVEEISHDSAHYRLTIPSGKADQYRLAQLDDYTLLSRRQFPHASGLTLSLSARTSSDSLPGTWGFGLWNDPFGLSLGFGGSPLRLPALPNAVWFFGASEENYLSFKEQGRGYPAPTGNGFMAQVFRSPRFHPLLIPVGMALPFSRKATRRMLGRVIEEDGVKLWSQGASSRKSDQQADGLQRVDPRQWHGYRLEWSLNRVSFEVDNVQVLDSPVSPHAPLGVVIWIDNQFAAFTPEGRIGFGVLENPEPAWLEIKDVEIK
ncbi:MAG: hypothetical protein QM730_26135 [Anaerolineales bacterium]